MEKNLLKVKGKMIFLVILELKIWITVCGLPKKINKNNIIYDFINKLLIKNPKERDEILNKKFSPCLNDVKKIELIEIFKPKINIYIENYNEILDIIIKERNYKGFYFNCWKLYHKLKK